MVAVLPEETMTTIRTALVLSLMIACSEGKDPAETDTDTDTVETDVPDTDVPSASTWNHVVTSIAVASPQESLDLDGDGAGDNALGALRIVLNPALAEALSTASRVLILQTADVDAATDTSVMLAAFGATDANADASDNAAAHFDPGPAVDAAGHALVATETALDAGAYATVLADQTLSFGDFTFSAATGLHLEGEVDAGAHAARMGIAIRVAPLADALTAAGKAELAGQLSALADLDTDGDTVADAISATFLLEAAPCEVP